MIKTKTAENQSFMSASNQNGHKSSDGVNVPKIVTAGLSGLAGGAVAAIVITGGAGIVAAVAGSIIGAAITGGTEYSKEKRQETVR
jgi:uncharacterized membrane protein YebE (DUF533 family)